jgi:hypothetical protein
MHLTPEGDVEDVTQPPFSARTLVHDEYGGGSYVVAEGGIYFSNYPDQHLCVKEDGREPICIASYKKTRYANLVVDEKHRSRVCVQEDHSQTDREPTNSIVRIDIDRGEKTTQRYLLSVTTFTRRLVLIRTTQN